MRVFAKGKGDGLADITGGSDDENANHGIRIWVEMCVVYWMAVCWVCGIVCSSSMASQYCLWTITSYIYALEESQRSHSARTLALTNAIIVQRSWQAQAELGPDDKFTDDSTVLVVCQTMTTISTMSTVCGTSGTTNS